MLERTQDSRRNTRAEEVIRNARKNTIRNSRKTNARQSRSMDFLTVRLEWSGAIQKQTSQFWEDQSQSEK